MLLPEVRDFLASKPLPMFLGGEWVHAKSGHTFTTRDPGTGEILATVANREEGFERKWERRHQGLCHM